MKPIVSIIGLGKLGASMMGCFSSKNIKVLGYDSNPNVIDLINKGKSPVDETGLENLIIKYKKNISVTNNLKTLLDKTNITFIVVPTPTANDGSYDLKIIKKVLIKFSKLLKNKKKYHLIVLCSTVLPEDSENKLIPIIEKYSKKTFKKKFGFIYSPEFISLGNIISEYLNPEIVLIGSESEKDIKILSNIYKKLYSSKKFKFMNLKEAELTKISVNSLMTAMISFSNMIGLFCLNMKNANSNLVLDTVKFFFKNFKKGYKSGLGYGGPCLPRDNLALLHLNNKFGLNISMPKSIDQTNNSIPRGLYNIFFKKIKNKKILFIGVSYKPKTSYYEKSQSITLINIVSKNNIVSVFDYNPIKIKLNPKIKIKKNITNAIKANDLIVLCHLDERYKKLNLKNKKVIDFWKQL
jgi:UDPglucose 6-dehydrogenase